MGTCADGRVLIGLAALAVGACADVPVVQGVPEIEANRAVGALDQVGIAARKEVEEGGSNGPPTFRVGVGQDEVARAVAVLNANALPRHEEPGFAETFGQASLVQTASEERARAAQAIAGELARTIETMDGVLDARVHLALVDAAPSLDGVPGAHSSASVLVRYAGARAPYDDAGLRRLVAGAVAGMRADDVAVVGLSRPLPPATRDTQLSWVGPIAVARGSAGMLRGVLVGSLGLNVLLAGGAIVLALRRRDRPESTAQG